jgi:hypothetical protein
MSVSYTAQHHSRQSDTLVGHFYFMFYFLNPLAYCQKKESMSSPVKKKYARASRLLWVEFLALSLSTMAIILFCPQRVSSHVCNNTNMSGCVCGPQWETYIHNWCLDNTANWRFEWLNARCIAAGDVTMFVCGLCPASHGPSRYLGAENGIMDTWASIRFKKVLNTKQERSRKMGRPRLRWEE